MNNATFFAADRTTHLKVVAISLVASIAVILIAMVTRLTSTEGVRVAGDLRGVAVKAGRPYLTSRNGSAVFR
jgi:hypothetical protein